MMAYSVGDRVWYVLAWAGDRPEVMIAAEVVRIGATRIGIVTVDGDRPRYVAPRSLTTIIPPGDVELVTAGRARGLANYG